MKSITNTQIINILNLLRERKYNQVRDILKDLPDIKQKAIKKIKELEAENNKLQPDGIAYYGKDLDDEINDKNSKIQALKEFFEIEDGELK